MEESSCDKMDMSVEGNRETCWESIVVFYFLDFSLFLCSYYSIIYNFVLVSHVQQSVCVCIYSFLILFHYKLLWDIECSSLSYKVGPFFSACFMFGSVYLSLPDLLYLVWFSLSSFMLPQIEIFHFLMAE